MKCWNCPAHGMWYIDNFSSCILKYKSKPGELGRHYCNRSKEYITKQLELWLETSPEAQKGGFSLPNYNIKRKEDENGEDV